MNKNNCIFVHIPKTGGTSIARTLSRTQNHITAQRYIHNLGMKKWNNSFTFTIVRNPWDREISSFFYRYKKDYGGVFSTEIFKKHLKRVYVGGIPNYIPWFANKKQESFVDFIGRFENLQNDIDYVCDKIGINRKKLLHVNKSNHKHYTEYYDDETREIVAKKYSDDIKLFNYSFE